MEEKFESFWGGNGFSDKPAKPEDGNWTEGLPVKEDDKEDFVNPWARDFEFEFEEPQFHE